MENIKVNVDNLPFIACGKGWYPLILQAIGIVQEYNKEHPNLKYPVEFTQIKEKWGYLNLYLNYYPDNLLDKMLELSEKSKTMCENCGTSKNVKTELTHGWIMTLCNDCRKKELIDFYPLKENLDNKLYNNENN